MVKNPPANAGGIRDAGSIPRSGGFPGGGHGNPLQYSCLENLMDRGVWQATVHRAAKSQTRLKQLSTHEDKHTPRKKEIIAASSSYPIFIRICQGLGKAFVFWRLSEQGHLNLVQCCTPGPGNHPRDVFHLLQGEKPLEQLCVPTALQNLVMSHI